MLFGGEFPVILHANWIVDSAVMAFWLEDERGDSAAGRTRGSAPGHPRALPAGDVVDRLPDELELFRDEMALLLPSDGREPVSCNGAVPADAQLAPWSIGIGEALAESFVEFVFFHGVDGLRTDSNGEPLTWSAGFRFWYELARFARLLYERQYCVPAVTQLEGKLYPAWRAVFNEAAEEQWQKLIKAMPPICRAVASESNPRQELPTQLAVSFVDACVDSLARRRIMRRSPRQVSLRKSNAVLSRQWLQTLRWGHFQTLNGTPTALQQLAADVESWTDYMRPTHLDVPWRPGFELRPPEVEVGPWRLEFVLTSVKNPAQRLRAEQVWNEPAVKSYVPTAREALLAGLGRALPVFPKLEDALRLADPECCELDRREATAFMADVAPDLRRLGFSVKLPEWWTESSESLGLRLQIDAIADTDGADRPSFLGVDNLVDYHWEVALGDEVLEEEEFRQLAQSKQVLVYRRGRWLHLDVEALNRSLDFLKNRGQQGRDKLSKVLKLGKKLEKDGGLQLVDIDLNERSTPFAAQLESGLQFEALPQPEKFQGFMPPYQIHGFSWMVFMKRLGLGACLADDMGLGKTIQMIATLLHEVAEDGGCRPTLIVCPMSVVGNWAKEINRFSPILRVMVHHGTDRQGKEDFVRAVADVDVVISTYNLVVRDKATFNACEWRNIVLDEAQNIKNPNTKQSTVIRGLRSRNRYCLTGTPIENRLTELWSLMDFLNPNYLGTLSAFRSTFSQPIEREQDQTRAKILQKIIRPFVLRRLKSDKDIIRDLPEKQEMKVFCNLTAEQAGLYQAVVDEMMQKIRESRGIERKGLVLSTLTKLKQITNHPAHFLRDNSPYASDRSGKLQRLEEMLDVVLENHDRALIFSQFTEMGEAMRRKLQNRFGTEILYLHGGTPKADRDEMIARFQNPHGPPIFLLSLKAGGVGLNLTAANHVFHFDRWWNPAIEDQATDRTYRIGQTKNVQVHKFICIGTVEEKIDQMIEDKKRLADNIVTAGESILTELTTDELQNVFALTRDAVVE